MKRCLLKTDVAKKTEVWATRLCEHGKKLMHKYEQIHLNIFWEAFQIEN